MAEARHRFWRRVGPAAVAGSALVIGLAAAGCDGGGTSTTNSGGSAGTNTGGTGGSTAGTGGTTGGSAGTTTGGTGGSTGGTMTTGGTGTGTNLVLTAVADAPSALDSTPDSVGNTIYYTAVKAGDPGIFKVTIKPDGTGGVITELYVNDPDGAGPLKLAAPFGISISGDDKALFVADTGYDVTPGDPDTPVGALLTLGTSPGTPTVVTGTEGYRPRGIDVFPEVSGDTLYFTGVDPMSGQAGVFTRVAAGGGVSKVAVGAPFVNPSGVAVGKSSIYVTDALAADDHLASLIVIDKATGTPSVLLDTIGVGYPAGVALSADEKTIYVSGIDLSTQTDQVLVVDVATKTAMPFTGQGLDTRTDAGGLHRARKAEVFSWADLTAGNGGTVFRVTFK